MTVLSLTDAGQPFDPMALTERLRIAHVVTRPLMQDILDKACRRFPSLGQTERKARLMRFIDAEAWADAALAQRLDQRIEAAADESRGNEANWQQFITTFRI